MKTLITGGAAGADTYFGNLSFSYMWKTYTIRHYDYEHSKHKDKIEQDYLLAINILKRPYISSDFYTGKLIRRNWIIQDIAEEVFAIGSLDNNNMPKGGTAYACLFAQMSGIKEVYFFDQNRKLWYKGSKEVGNFIETDTPFISRNIFAGIGTRLLNDTGKKEIHELYKRTPLCFWD